MTAIPISGRTSARRSARAGLALPRRLPAWRPHTEVGRAPLPTAAAMCAVIFVLRMVLDNETANGLTLLYTIPIMLLTAAYGTGAGAAAATAACALMFLWADVQTVHLGAVGFAMRGVAFFIVPLAVAVAAESRGPESGGADGSPTGQATPVRAADPPKSLTRRELEVLSLLAGGHTNAEIAEKLVLSVRTVESHRASMQRKLGRPSRPELVRYALRRGLVPGA